MLSKPKTSLSREERKILQIEQLFKKQEKEERRRANRRNRKISSTFPHKYETMETFEETTGHSVKESRQSRKASMEPIFLIHKRLSSELEVKDVLEVFPARRELSGRARLKFDTKEDFENNFGEENWLVDYQEAEISRNTTLEKSFNKHDENSAKHYELEYYYYETEGIMEYSSGGKCYPSVSASLLQSCYDPFNEEWA